MQVHAARLSGVVVAKSLRCRIPSQHALAGSADCPTKYGTHGLRAKSTSTQLIAWLGLNITTAMASTAITQRAAAPFAILSENMLAMAVVMFKPSHAISCVDVDLALKPCVPYLVGQSAEPAKACCDGIMHLKDLATTTPDRRAACTCMKDAASHLPGLKDSAVTALPLKCNVPLPYPISPSVDCSK
ncbi:hypothetical protein J5N97_008731 [Dioscorea zingiberensis]|uniref:Non-specific lipid-transfer protein n=1 Tax=Dioscorea zingiberensis TaxID=325984 RepID=A0A9D5HLA7_9LILI|nr:hypothetical protein J5N97_008731 [Dioscorea zingiberensis]